MRGVCRIFRLTSFIPTVVLAVGIAAAASPDEDEDRLYPFPPGEHAALTRQTCAACHDPSVVTTKRYDEESARRYFRIMVGNPDTETARKVITYLSTVLAEE
jgi:hypothetical protein